MRGPSCIIGAAFESDRLLTVWGREKVRAIGLHPVCELGLLDGGPFFLACANREFLFTVQNNDTAPFLPSFVLVYRISDQKFVKSFEFSGKVLGLQVVNGFLYVSLAASVQVLDISSGTFACVIERASKDGCFCATPTVLAFTSDNSQGSVTIASAPDYSISATIQCHEDPVRCISVCGGILTTASNKGTIIRTFDIKTGRRLNEFRRGFRNSVIIALDSSETMTCACSKTSLHVFSGVMTHIVIHLTVEPISCAIIRGAVGVVGIDGVLSVYEVDVMCSSAKVITQHCVIDSSVADVNNASASRL
jgi:hypothetical protein